MPAIAALVQRGVGIGIFPVVRLDGLPETLKARRVITQAPAEGFDAWRGLEEVGNGRASATAKYRFAADCRARAI